MLLFDDPYHAWMHECKDGQTLYFKGDEVTAYNILRGVRGASVNDLVKQLSNTLQSAVHYTSGAIENEQYIVAWVDHIRSWPVFYTCRENTIRVAAHARTLQKESGLDKIDKAALTEFSMSGFVSGKHTVVQDLFCLQPGEFLIFDKSSSTLITERYFQYVPEYINTESQESKKQELGHILDEIIADVIRNAAGRTIWVPLSAGLDSRILLCKLHEHGYQNIQTFTYGPKYNFEARHAQRVAKTLGVPWRMIPLSRRQIKKFFNSPERQKFWQYADNLKATPCMGGVAALSYLHQEKIIQPGSVFINGQSGDYITGGHVFSDWFNVPEITYETFVNAIIKKHYGLWKTLKTNQNVSLIRDKISTLVDVIKDDNSLSARASQLESWEYDARQVCYVANGQRMYEFFGNRWEMPLWDKRLVMFCQTLSLSDKQGQYLYKEYLKDYNYMGLFPDKEPNLWRWPVPMLWVVLVANLLRFFPRRKEKFYALMRYFGHYSDQFNMFSFKDHLNTYKNSRSVTSLNARQWMLENIDASERFTVQGWKDYVD